MHRRPQLSARYLPQQRDTSRSPVSGFRDVGAPGLPYAWVAHEFVELERDQRLAYQPRLRPMPRLGFERFESVLYQTTSLLWDGYQAVAVDPSVTSEEVSRITERAHELGVRITDVLAIHADWDHICGIAAFSEAAATMGEETAARIRSGETTARLSKAAVEFGLAPLGTPRVDRVLAAGVAHRVGGSNSSCQRSSSAGTLSDQVTCRACIEMPTRFRDRRPLDAPVLGERLMERLPRPGL